MTGHVSHDATRVFHYRQGLRRGIVAEHVYEEAQSSVDGAQSHFVHGAVSCKIPKGGEDGLESRFLLARHCSFGQTFDGAYFSQHLLAVCVGSP